MNFFRFLCGVLLVLCSVIEESGAQEFIHYNLTDGLSSVEVTDIRENENFIWIATSDGLNRFDGKHFKVFRHQSGSLNSLTENYIECLYFDSGGKLWIGLKSGGVDIYDPKSETFSHLNEMINAKVPGRVISILEDSQKNIWLGTWEEGVYKLTPVEGSKRTYTVEIHYPGYIVSSIIEKPEGFVRAGTYFGFFVYDMARKQWIENDHRSISVTQFLDIGEENEIWCSTWNSGLIKLKWDKSDPGHMLFKETYPGETFTSVFRIVNGKDGTLYLGTWGKGISIFRINQPGQSLTHSIYPSSLINTLYRDKSGNIWAGTYGEGILRFNNDETGIRHFPPSGKIPAPATALASYGKGNVLLGTQGSGLFVFSPDNNRLVPAWSNSDRRDLRNYILSLYSDTALIFIGHDGEGIPYSVPNINNSEELLLNIINHFPSTDKITAFHRAPDGTIWIGTKQNGLSSFRFNPKSGLPENYAHYDNFGRDEITGFAHYDDSTLLISSHNGLFRFNIHSGRIIGNQGLSNELIYKILNDESNNCLWIGTSTNLLKINYGTGSPIPEPAFPDFELPQGTVRSMISDRSNNLWFSIGGQLFCYQDKDRIIREVNADMLGNYAILSSAKTISDKEKLIFGTTDNLIIIDPARLLDRENEGRIVLTELQVDHERINAGDSVFGIKVMEKAAEYSTEINLSYKCRWISLQFVEAGLDMFVNRYQYYIKGFSHSWQYLDIANPITFSQLNPGQYTLQIRNYGNGPAAPVCWSMVLNVIPPWWRTVWFSVLLAIALILLTILSVLLFVRFNRRKHIAELKKIEKEKEDELLREKESFFTGLSHDLMTPFSLIMSPANDLIREYQPEDSIKEKLKIIRKNATLLSDIFGTILDFKRAELSDNDTRETQLEIVAFTRLVVKAFEYLASSRKIHLGYSANIASLEIISDNVKIERILFNLISNALKFTPEGGRVDIEVIHEHNELSFIVRDTGSGIDFKNQARIFEQFFRETEGEFHKKNKGLGLGLYIVRKFTDKLGGSVTVNSAPGKGTEIKVSVPVKVVSFVRAEAEQKSTVPVSDDKSTILVVEDDEELRDYLSNKLSPHFNIFTALNGRQALASIESVMPEIIITDIMMPDMDGLTLTRKIKENSQYSDIFMVLLTALVTTDDELEGYKKGADLYIKKPFDGEVLLNQMINIHSTTQKRKNQILSWLVSGEVHTEIEFDSRESFLRRSMQVIEEHIMEPGFRINEFASSLNISKSVLHRKFRLLIGQTPNQFIRLVRLRKSVHLLQNTGHSIAEIAYLTGFNQSHYYIKCFREVYNQTPGEFRASSS